MATNGPNESSIKKEDRDTYSKNTIDPQMAKYQTMKRIEREKRAMNKKLMYEEYDRRGHPVTRKKTAKTNWIKHYENGTLDEDMEDFYI
ncbi:MAG TPA: hypothetical protein GX002_07705 [Clostridiales bacterium]|nr:hypothetical protein [Clostridiales bacterium]